MEAAAVTDTRPVQAPALVLNPRFTMEAMREDLKRNFRNCANRSGMLRWATANEAMREAAERPQPEALWLTLWHEGELCCLFADSNAGKSVYAVQIAEEIAKKRSVLYIDFELSDKQFQMRYTDDSGNTHQFPDNLIRVWLDPEAFDLSHGSFEERVLEDIAGAAEKCGAKVVIVDNLSFLCMNMEKGVDAGELMRGLIRLKRQNGLSILVIAHTPKRSPFNPITQNDLAGSKRLMNFFDSAFAIGKSARDPGLRYVKQIKVRSCAEEYGADNVIVYSLEKEGSWLKFSPRGFSSEREHLKEEGEQDKAEREERNARIMQLHSQGWSTRKIAEEVGISNVSVSKVIKSAGGA